MLSNNKNNFKYSYPLTFNVPFSHIAFFILAIVIWNYFLIQVLQDRNLTLENYQLFDISTTFIFLFFLIKNRISILKKIILITILALILITLNYLTDHKFTIAYHLFILFALLPFLLNVIANHHLLDIPFWLFLNMQTYTYNNVNLFTNTKGQKEHHTTDAIYIDLFFLNQEGEDKKLHAIAKEYLRLIKFWYAYENYRFKIRYFFPLLGLSLSVFIYLWSLFFFNSQCKDIEYLPHISIMSIYLLILFFSINLHANNFLSSKFYMGNILDKLNQIYFDQHEYRHQIKLFLDKNFLIYIHDRNYDQELCVNTSKSFQKFISKETLDKEGRNNILTIFISFIMIFLIEVLVNVQHPNIDKNNTKEEKCSKIITPSKPV